MSAHTPGPWAWANASNHGEWFYAEALRGEGSSVAFARGSVMALAEEDARLIAAAPDLLEALQTIENDTGQVPGWLWRVIQKAIAKATGEATP